MKISKTADIATAWRSAATEVPLVGIVDDLEALEFLGDEDQSLLRAVRLGLA